MALAAATKATVSEGAANGEAGKINDSSVTHEGATAGLSLSFVHLYFNVVGIIILYPFRKVPIYLARRVARFMSANRKMAIVFLIVVFYLIPGAVILIDRLLFT